MGAIGSVNALKEALSTVVVQFEAINCENREQVGENVDRICQFMEKAQVKFPDYDLILYPESCVLGAGTCDLALSLSDSEIKELTAKCRELNVWGCFNFHRKHSEPNQHPWNTAIIVNGQGEIVLVYDKVNPFVPGEKTTPGNKLSVVKGPKDSVLGVMICYDRDFPEVSRELAMKGANILIVVACYPAPFGEAGRFLNRARALENMAYLVCASSAGRGETGSFYSGQSMIVNFDGNIIVEAPRGIEYVIKADLYPFLVESARKQYTVRNYLHHLKHRGYSALPPDGDTKNPYTIYRNWR